MDGHSPDELGDELQMPSPSRKKVGGSYSRYTGGGGLSRGLTIDGDLVDSSGRKIKREGKTGNGTVADGGQKVRKLRKRLFWSNIISSFRT